MEALVAAALGDPDTDEQSIQDLIIKFAPVLDNADLYALTARLTDSVKRRSTPSSPPPPPPPSAAAILEPAPTYRVLQKAVLRARADMSSEAIGVLSPGDTLIPVAEQVVSREARALYALAAWLHA